MRMGKIFVEAKILEEEFDEIFLNTETSFLQSHVDWDSPSTYDDYPEEYDYVVTAKEDHDFNEGGKIEVAEGQNIGIDMDSGAKNELVMDKRPIGVVDMKALMGLISQEPPRDLKVTRRETSLVFPSERTERKSLYLSNIDQVLNFDVQTVHFFHAHVDYPPDVATERIRSGLSRVLAAYDFLAGRLRPSNGSGGEGAGRLVIDCDGSGVGFVVASSEYSLEEIGDLVYPNPAFRQLILQGSGLDELGTDGDLPLCVVQVTSFKCGGFAMGISTNHATFDGISFKIFLENLASQASDEPYLAIAPCNDRRLLAARSPPQVTFPHPELLKLQFLTPGHDQTPPLVFDCAQDHDLDFKIFRLTSADVSLLKENTKSGAAAGATKAKITGFNVVMTHVWRCKALSSRETSRDPDRSSTVLYAVDIRPRLDPPLPKSYAGNAVLTAYATATCRELEEMPPSALVEMVSEGARRMTDEYARSAIDWGELYRGFPNGEFLVSSWWRLGFAQVKYPWGKPRYSCPVVYHRKDIILLFPDIEDDDDDDERTTGSNSGVNVLVALPHEEMLVFEKHFHKFLACTI
ncbi:hypothetical protein RHGRI_027166 [Rhododendron griersonianum]|uniref:Omega-hydroxypalmitate O-feruloyl transferase n=1 Tax=Rhododendron griersonianum TaxID=479676 RepID=A0AAV6J0A8_9ERIC|nr:hypothetical protein RHGRI_027166 [Rhododendron griersonianum]